MRSSRHEINQVPYRGNRRGFGPLRRTARHTPRHSTHDKNGHSKDDTRCKLAPNVGSSLIQRLFKRLPSHAGRGSLRVHPRSSGWDCFETKKDNSRHSEPSALSSRSIRLCLMIGICICTGTKTKACPTSSNHDRTPLLDHDFAKYTQIARGFSKHSLNHHVCLSFLLPPKTLMHLQV